MINNISKISAKTYANIIKPILFKIDSEKVHDFTLKSASLLGRAKPINWLIKYSWGYSAESLKQTIDGIEYLNPIGLAAGWDKDAKAISFMTAVGFGFTEVGSITKEPYQGNQGSRLKRLKNSKSILVNYGLKNQGVDIISPRIKKQKSTIPVGTNIARTNSPKCEDDKVSIEDYVYSFNKLTSIGDYFTINISCPNTFGGQPFHDGKRLEMLLTCLDKIPTQKPIYLKLSPDITYQERKDIAKLSFLHRVDGFICGNLTKERKLDTIHDINIPDDGGMSGMVVQQLSDQLIADMHKLTMGKKTIIGLGGIFSAEDAYRKIKLGASLIQIITGLIYEGPQVVGQINLGLAQLLQNDGYDNIRQAVGTDNT